MLHIAPSQDGQVFTVYSKDLAIGGLVAEARDCWRWAVFCVRAKAMTKSGDFAPLGGTARSRTEALEALQARWTAWLDAAGLSRPTAVHAPVQRSLDEITLDAPHCRREGVVRSRLRRARRIERALQR